MNRVEQIIADVDRNIRHTVDPRATAKELRDLIFELRRRVLDQIVDWPNREESDYFYLIIEEDTLLYYVKNFITFLADGRILLTEDRTMVNGERKDIEILQAGKSPNILLDRLTNQHDEFTRIILKFLKGKASLRVICQKS